MDEQRLTKDERKKIRHQEWQEQLNNEHKRKIRNRILTWGIGGVVLLLALWFLFAVVNQPSSSNTSNIKMPRITSKDIQSGPANAKIQLVEYADFECPTCKAFYPLIKQLQLDFKEKLLFVYRFFPLYNIHPNAINSADAAWAANKQGKFWEMHDLLFENQDTWATSTTAKDIFVTYAQKLNLNVDQFKKDLNDPATTTFVTDQANAALDIGLNGTPTFFLNGKQILSNPTSYADFKNLLQNQFISK